MLDVQDTEQGRLTCQILPFIAGYSRLEGTVTGSCCRRAVDGYQCRGECSAVSVKEGSPHHKIYRGTWDRQTFPSIKYGWVSGLLCEVVVAHCCKMEALI